ncbi:MAG: hypothetical protein JWO03_2599 [Bacteroidetes bacterium]|nr:hypothetical protein [Bacteroidota bacterium]
MPSYTEQTISEINKYISFILELKVRNEKNGNKADLLFRGQDIDRPLLPKIARLTLKGSDTMNIEKLMLTEFKRGIPPLAEFKLESNLNWDLLALAQHHGLPTRLLDWTYSALVALWFTVKSPPQKDSSGNFENGVVWVLSALKEDFRTDTETIDPLSNKITKIFRPSVVTRRISAQAGVFTVHKINANNQIIRFETHKDFAHKLSKILIPHSQFAAIRKQLHILGVNSSTVFPYLDGYGKHLEWRYSYYSDELTK